MYSGKERRRLTRYGTGKMVARVMPLEAEPDFRRADQVHLVDLNSWGLAFVTRADYREGDALMFELVMDELRVEDLSGTVHSSIPEGDGCRFGVQFDTDSQSLATEALHEMEARLGSHHVPGRSKAQRRIQNRNRR